MIEAATAYELAHAALQGPLVGAFTTLLLASVPGRVPGRSARDRHPDRGQGPS